MTDWTKRSLNIKLDFLDKDKTYSISIWKDGINANKIAIDYKKIIMDVTSNSKLELNLESGGGWVAIITEK